MTFKVIQLFLLSVFLFIIFGGPYSILIEIEGVIVQIGGRIIIKIAESFSGYGLASEDVLCLQMMLHVLSFWPIFCY
jgi:hypothetical protein